MKSIIFAVGILLAVALMLNSCATIDKKHVDIKTDALSSKPVEPRNNIVGSWYDVHSQLRYIFDDEGFATVEVGYQKIGGRGENIGSALKYEIDYSKYPIPLDLIHFNKVENRLTSKIAMIIDFIDNDNIKIRTFMTNERPTEFKEKDHVNTVVLAREKEDAEN